MTFVVAKITEEPNTKGTKKLRVRVERNGKSYLFGVKKSDYLDEAKRESIHRVWFKSIKEMEEDAKAGPETSKGKKDKKALDSLIGKEVEVNE